MRRVPLKQAARSFGPTIGIGLGVGESEEVHSVEVPHHVPHEPAKVRLKWNAITAVEIFFLTLVLAWALGRARSFLRRWFDANGRAWTDEWFDAVCYIDGESGRWPLVLGGDSLELRPVEVRASEARAAGTVHCRKNGGYRVGRFTLTKNREEPNTFDLVIAFDGGRTKAAHLRRTW